MATVNAFVYRLRSKVMIYSQDEKEREREKQSKNDRKTHIPDII